MERKKRLNTLYSLTIESSEHHLESSEYSLNNMNTSNLAMSRQVDKCSLDLKNKIL